MFQKYFIWKKMITMDCFEMCTKPLMLERGKCYFYGTKKQQQNYTVKMCVLLLKTCRCTTALFLPVHSLSVERHLNIRR